MGILDSFGLDNFNIDGKIGLKIAYGSANVSWTGWDTSPVEKLSRITVNNLDFSPRILLVQFNYVYVTTSNYYRGIVSLSRDSNVIPLEQVELYNNGGGYVVLAAYSGNWYLANGFDINFKMYSTWSGGPDTNTTVKWLAIE